MILKNLLSKYYNLDEIDKIYLIPSKDLEISKINKINKEFIVDKNTLIIRFNNCNLTNKKLFDNKTDIRFARCQQRTIDMNQDYTLFGETNINTNTLYIIHNNKLEELNLIKKVNNIKNIFSFGELNIIFDYDNILRTYPVKHKNITNKSASIGFIAIYNLINVFKNAKFYLLDFTFPKFAMHDMQLEKEICEKYLKDRVIII